MATYSPGQLYLLGRAVGWDAQDARTAAAIALAESGGITDRAGDVLIQDRTWGPSWGLWQIRSVKAQSGTGNLRDATRLTDPAFNARSAYSISAAGRNWGPWTVYKTGAYRRHLDAVNRAADGLDSSPSLGARIRDALLTPPGVVGRVTGPLAGPDAGGMAREAASALNPLGGLTSALTSRGTWIRVIEVVAGLTAVAIGVFLATRPLMAKAGPLIAKAGPVGGAVSAVATVAGG